MTKDNIVEKLKEILNELEITKEQDYIQYEEYLHTYCKRSIKRLLEDIEENDQRRNSCGT